VTERQIGASGVLALWGVLAWGVPGCAEDRLDGAARLVARYNRVVAEAYRAADARLVDEVAGPAEAKRLTALIGVKLDQGLALDARLESLTVLDSVAQGEEVRVTTDERWTYRDRRIGSGEPVGDPSTDHYRLEYTVARPADRWLVMSTRFVAPPEVGRTAAPSGAPARTMHGLPSLPVATPREAP